MMLAMQVAKKIVRAMENVVSRDMLVYEVPAGVDVNASHTEFDLVVIAPGGREQTFNVQVRAY